MLMSVGWIGNVSSDCDKRGAEAGIQMKGWEGGGGGLAALVRGGRGKGWRTGPKSCSVRERISSQVGKVERKGVGMTGHILMYDGAIREEVV